MGQDEHGICHLQTRLSGGTNAAAACIRAAAELEQLDADVQRVIIFMSDFRMDEYSGELFLILAPEQSLHLGRWIG